MRAAAREAGYRAAYGLPGSHRAHDPYSLPRVDIYRRDTLLQATLKTTPLFRSASALLQAVRR